MRKAYFPVVKNAPSPLSLNVRRRVRFEEVDFMGIVWHGCYLSYFEDGRVALGHQYGISYSDFIRERIRVPVRQMRIDYHYPLQFEEDFEIKTILHWSDSARINLEYEIRNAPGKLVCTGYTVQLMLDEHSNVFLMPPPFFSDFLRRWNQGELA
jgi:acyl-CoA thioester hydrolase